MTTATSNRVLFGMILMTLAMLVLPFMDAIVKFLSN